jgi:hypothetical protein
VRVEHALAGVKITRIAKDQFRIPAEGLSDVVMQIACALHNPASGVPAAYSPPSQLDRVFSVDSAARRLRYAAIPCMPHTLE